MVEKSIKIEDILTEMRAYQRVLKGTRLLHLNSINFCKERLRVLDEASGDVHGEFEVLRSYLSKVT